MNKRKLEARDVYDFLLDKYPSQVDDESWQTLEGVDLFKFTVLQSIPFCLMDANATELTRSFIDKDFTNPDSVFFSAQDWYDKYCKATLDIDSQYDSKTNQPYPVPSERQAVFAIQQLRQAGVLDVIAQPNGKPLLYGAFKDKEHPIFEASRTHAGSINLIP